MSDDEVKALLDAQRVPPRRDDDASRGLGFGAQALHLDDGSFLLWIDPGGGALYRSYEDYLVVSRDAERDAERGAVDPVAELLPPARELVAGAPGIAAGVARAIGAPDPLDGTVASLEKIERLVARLPRARRLSKGVVTALVAYVGEVIRRAVNGRWEVRRTGNGGDAGEPVVVDPGGRVHQPFGVVYKELVRGRRGSIYGALQGELGSLSSGRFPSSRHW